jgi:hypothetical protein
MSWFNKWAAGQNGRQCDAGQAQQNGMEPLTYNWRFPHDLWLAIAVNEEGGIALAIHPRDGILAGAFPQGDANGVSHQPGRSLIGQSPTSRRRE